MGALLALFVRGGTGKIVLTGRYTLGSEYGG
jgi:hypothetical protein